MSTVRLHRGWRKPNGLVTDHVAAAQPTVAATASEAMSAAPGDGDFLVTDEANLVWLTDKDVVIVWSLRLDDDNTEPRP